MEHNMKLQQDAYLPLRDVVFNTLRDAILRGELQPGERLMEIHLAKELGVSRTPIREAIRMLEQEGLAITFPRRGAQVAKMSEKDLDDVLEIREVLDSLAAYKACEKMTEKEYDELEKALYEFEDAIKSGDLNRIVESDEEFHGVIYRAAKNPRLLTILRNLKEQMHRFRFEYAKKTEVYPELIREHEEIYKALKEKRKEDVKDISITHLLNQMEGVRAAIKSQE